MRRIKLLISILMLGTAATVCAQQTDMEEPARSVPMTDIASPEPHVKTINERRRERGLTEISNVIVPRGQWIFGGTVSYSTHSNDNYTAFIIEGINSNGYTFRVSPLIAYSVRDNMAVGARFAYSRTMQKIDKANVNFSETNGDGLQLSVDHYFALQQSYSAIAVWRQYIPLGASKRFAIFTEMQLSAGSTQAKFASGQPVKGTYQTGFDLGIGVTPGLVAFATNNMAIEVSVGVMGISYSHVKQVHNQVTVGERNTSNMNFKVNIFSIGLGFAFYL